MTAAAVMPRSLIRPTSSPSPARHQRQQPRLKKGPPSGGSLVTQSSQPMPFPLLPVPHRSGTLRPCPRRRGRLAASRRVRTPCAHDTPGERTSTTRWSRLPVVTDTTSIDAGPGDAALAGRRRRPRRRLVLAVVVLVLLGLGLWTA